MKDIIEFAKKNGSGFLGTVAQGKPRLRGWLFILYENDKFYFCTSNQKEVYKQLLDVPHAEWASMDTQTGDFVRISGDVTFIKDLAIKEKILGVNPVITDIYKSVDNPIFEVFTLSNGEAEYFSFDTSKNKVVKY